MNLFISLIVPAFATRLLREGALVTLCGLSSAITLLLGSSGGGAGVVVCLERDADLHMAQVMPLPLSGDWWGAGMVICMERGADLHMAQLMPLLLTVSCFRTI